jgi:amino acid transporter
MFWKQLFAKKSLEMLHAEAAGENRLRRVLGPIGLTSLGVGAIIGAGIFVMTGRAAALDAGPGIMVSYIVAGLGCLFAALCYAEFASTAPVAGSAYTYAYTTLGELLAWIIGWDLILEYAMACACVAASWSKYLNTFLKVFFNTAVPDAWCNDPFTHTAYFNAPAMIIILICTVILVIGIRESATTNAILVGIKLGVVLFVIGVGAVIVGQTAGATNWFGIQPSERITPEDRLLPDITRKEVTEGIPEREYIQKRISRMSQQIAALYYSSDNDKVAKKKTEAIIEHFYQQFGRLPKDEAKKRIADVTGQVMALLLIKNAQELHKGSLTKEEENEILARRQRIIDRTFDSQLKFGQIPEDEPKIIVRRPPTPADQDFAEKILAKVEKKAPEQERERWGLLGLVGLDQVLMHIDDSFRSPFLPYGLSGIMLGAAIVFFAYIGFDSISTHAEEARLPHRDVPIGILASLVLCTVLYIAVSAVITGMVPYPEIDRDAAVAEAFREAATVQQSPLLNLSAGLIATGALAGMTSVLLITFLSQARIFLAMARDGLLPDSIFGAVHPVFKTPHRSTILTGVLMAVVAAFTPILKLEEMVNIGTLAAFVIVCAAVLMLRLQRPDAHRPFKAPLIFVVGPLGIFVNLLMMLFLPLDTWGRLVVWLIVGLIIYVGFSQRHSVLGKLMRKENGVAETAPSTAIVKME